MTQTPLTRRKFVGATALTVLASATVARARDLGVTIAEQPLNSWRIGLVQSAPWDIDPARLQEDTTRNLERMLETIAREGRECDWLAFNDCPLTGRSASIVPTSTQIQALRATAQQHACALSFGYGAERRAMLIPADGTDVQSGPLVTLNGRRIAIVSTAQSDADITGALHKGAEALLIMGSGPNIVSTRISDVATSLHVPRLHVSAACDTYVPGHTHDWLGGTRACDARGRALGHVAHADETVLQVQLLFDV
jgi:predicted amidohydrolase